MKSVKMFVVAVIAAISLSAQATSMEEICHERAEHAVQLKQRMNVDHEFLPWALNDLKTAKVSAKVKEAIRENLFYIHNRKHLSDTDMQRLSFLRCIIN